ncbi:flagellar hook-basal body complex protein FliE [Virgibacillus sp. 179-BFC.A HS]|uniref:Flagellar hook-basal body complex protein FliE n=1 Tax=Tigheibacillus jepli TaxID=3035914 RepID=A0ABU5CHR7_9BACI|nr:flagellar hook-basal body complex protein FliE [Virgibacillus sp. 179-BFC.A HS]MDY0405889.1 flagellar hook-basal body complex protein FliE [Virgibacillus sp. 179-BFC.A HS]
MTYINNVQNMIPPTNNQLNPKVNGDEKSIRFGDLLKDAINQMNDAQIASDKKTVALASGNIDNLHDVLITAQKANITLQTAVQIQRKALDAYNETMRMQV